jgi:hypothetical protein
MNFDKITSLYDNKFQIQNAVHHLEQIKDKLFRTDTNIMEEINANLNPALQTIVMELIEKSPKDHEKINELLDEIIKSLKNIPVLKIISAFQINFRLMSKIANHLEQTAGKKIIVNQSQDNRLKLNQIVIEYQGRIVNYTSN